MEDGFGNDHQENTLPGVYLAWTRERALEKTAIFLDTPTSRPRCRSSGGEEAKDNIHPNQANRVVIPVVIPGV